MDLFAAYLDNVKPRFEAQEHELRDHLGKKIAQSKKQDPKA